MNKVIFCIFFIVCLAAPPCQSAIAPKSPNNSPSKQGKELNYYGYGMSSTESSRKGGDRKLGKLHEADHHLLNVSKKAKPSYGGSGELKRNRPAKNRSSSLLLKPTFLFSSALAHLAAGFFICVMLIV